MSRVFPVNAEMFLKTAFSNHISFVYDGLIINVLSADGLTFQFGYKSYRYTLFGHEVMYMTSLKVLLTVVSAYFNTLKV